MQRTNTIQNWVASLDRRTYAIVVGLAIGIIAGILGLSLATLGPALTLAALLGVFAGLFILTDIQYALYGIILLVILLPFGTFPVKIAVTPTLLDLALIGFLFVYIFQWMTGHRRRLRFAPPMIAIGLYVMWLILAFVLGFQYSLPSATNLRQFAETILSIGLVVLVGDVIRDPSILRRVIIVILLAVGAQALVTLVLYILPDATTESLLVRLSRIGYPDGGVVRYIEDNPALRERAIGTWVDPNALGGILAMATAIVTTQLLSEKPVIKYRWVTFCILAVVGLALLLTFSRASFLAVAVGLVFISIIRYRRFLPIIIIAGILFLFLPQTQEFLDRLIQAFTATDLATQMRLGEWRDSLQLIQQYPIVGIGFTGSPNAILYTDVANLYLIMANQIGLVGVFIFLGAMGSVLVYGLRVWNFAQENEELNSIILGLHIALVIGLVNSVADLYYFRLDFQSSITWFWLVITLAIASARLASEDSTNSQ